MTTPWFEIGLGGVLAFAEAILGVGIFLPGEVAVTGVATSIGSGERPLLLGAVTLGAATGDHLNYWLGRYLGPRLAASKVVARIGAPHWDRAVELVNRHGAWTIIGSHLLPVVRTLTVAVAGVTSMPYRRFALASLTGSLLWATLWVVAGGAARHVLANPGWLVPICAILLAVLLLRRRKNQRATSEFQGTAAEPAARGNRQRRSPGREPVR